MEYCCLAAGNASISAQSRVAYAALLAAFFKVAFNQEGIL
jgi:hypothetical protein